MTNEMLRERESDLFFPSFSNKSLDIQMPLIDLQQTFRVLVFVSVVRVNVSFYECKWLYVSLSVYVWVIVVFVCMWVSMWLRVDL